MSSITNPIPIPLIPDEQVRESELLHTAFLSHEGTEKRTVLNLLLWKLRQHGIPDEKIFYNGYMKWGGNVGEDIADRLKNVLLASEYMVVFLTAEFLRKRWQMWELRTFLEMMKKDKRRKLLPVFYRLSAGDCRSIAKQKIRDELKEKLGSIADIEEVRLTMEKVSRQFGVDAQGLHISDSALVDVIMRNVFGVNAQQEDRCRKTPETMNEAKVKLRIPPSPQHFVPMDRKGLPEFDIKQYFLRNQLAASGSYGGLVIGVYGMPGAGKSCACVAIAKDENILNHFERRVFWIQCHQNSAVEDALRYVACIAEVFGCDSIAVERQLASDSDVRSKWEALAYMVREACSDRQFLLIVDNVWRFSVLEPFLSAAGDIGSILFSTRQYDVVSMAGASPFEAKELPDDMALALLEEWGGKPLVENEKIHAKKLVDLCGNLAMAVKIAGATVRRRLRKWLAVIKDFESKLKILQKERPGSPDVSVYTNMKAMISVSFDLLSEETRSALLDLGVVESKTKIPSSALEKIWNACRAEVERNVESLAKAALVSYDRVDDVVIVHDVIIAFAAQESRDLLSTHRRVVNNYAATLKQEMRMEGEILPDNKERTMWWRVDQDGYFEFNITRHLEAIRCFQEVVWLVGGGKWRWYQMNSGNYGAFSRDVQRAISCESEYNNGSDIVGHGKSREHHESWAFIKFYLANVHCLRFDGSRKENVELAIQHYNHALIVWRRESYPAHWATTVNNLGVAYSDRVHGKKSENIEKAIQYYTDTLQVHTRKSYSEKWAMTMNNLGAAYGDRLYGEKSENIEKAIWYYTNALKAYTRESYPEKWAMTMNNLGVAYKNRLHGERNENVEKAIMYYRNVLKVYRRESYPEKWAITMNNLGVAYKNRLHGEKNENVEKAILYYTNVLKVYRRESYPEKWATTMNNLGIAYKIRLHGERNENVEKAIFYYTNALKICTRESYPEKWAMTMNNLGIAYKNRLHGERNENVEKAIQYYTNALEIYRRESYPEKWAMTMSNLGAAYSDRLKGEKDENIEKAIQYYTNALKVQTQESYGEDWAMTMSKLGAAYGDRLYGEKSENIERAIQYYTSALKIYTRESHPEKWAMTMNNLGVTYKNRLYGEKSENVEKAIMYYMNVLEIYGRESNPEKWAMTMNNLGVAYKNRLHGEKNENVEKAILYYKNVLKVYTRESYPEKWAMTMSNLGAACADLRCGESNVNIEKVIQNYTSALEMYTRESYPEKWAKTMSNLGIAYKNRLHGEKNENIEKAIQYYTNALEIYRRESHPEKWAMTMSNLGAAYGDRLKGEKNENIERAIQYYTNALEIYRRESHPEKWAMTMSNLGAAYGDRLKGEKNGNIERAIQYYTNALEIYRRESYPEKWAMTMSNLGIAYKNRLHGEKHENIEKAIQYTTNALKVQTRESYAKDWAMTMSNLGAAYGDRLKGEKNENIEKAIQYNINALKVQTRESYAKDWAITMSNLGSAYKNRLHGERKENVKKSISYYINVLKIDRREVPEERWEATLSNLQDVFWNYLDGEKSENDRKVHASAPESPQCDDGAALSTSPGDPKYEDNHKGASVPIQFDLMSSSLLRATVLALQHTALLGHVKVPIKVTTRFIVRAEAQGVGMQESYIDSERECEVRERISDVLKWFVEDRAEATPPSTIYVDEKKFDADSLVNICKCSEKTGPGLADNLLYRIFASFLGWEETPENFSATLFANGMAGIPNAHVRAAEELEKRLVDTVKESMAGTAELLYRFYQHGVRPARELEIGASDAVPPSMPSTCRRSVFSLVINVRAFVLQTMMELLQPLLSIPPGVFNLALGMCANKETAKGLYLGVEYFSESSTLRIKYLRQVHVKGRTRGEDGMENYERTNYDRKCTCLDIPRGTGLSEVLEYLTEDGIHPADVIGDLSYYLDDSMSQFRCWIPSVMRNRGKSPIHSIIVADVPILFVMPVEELKHLDRSATDYESKGGFGIALHHVRETINGLLWPVLENITADHIAVVLGFLHLNFRRSRKQIPGPFPKRQSVSSAATDWREWPKEYVLKDVGGALHLIKRDARDEVLRMRPSQMALSIKAPIGGVGSSITRTEKTMPPETSYLERTEARAWNSAEELINMVDNKILNMDIPAGWAVTNQDLAQRARVYQFLQLAGIYETVAYKGNCRGGLYCHGSPKYEIGHSVPMRMHEMGKLPCRDRSFERAHNILIMEGYLDLDTTVELQYTATYKMSEADLMLCGQPFRDEDVGRALNEKTADEVRLKPHPKSRTAEYEPQVIWGYWGKLKGES